MGYRTSAGFQNAVDAPAVAQPVEACEILCGDLHLRECSAIRVDAADGDVGFGFCAVVYGDLPHQPRYEVAELLFPRAFRARADRIQTVVVDRVMVIV